MPDRRFGPIRFVHCLVIGGAVAGCAPACPCENPPVFGGVEAPQVAPLPAAATGDGGPCGEPSPPDARALIDDFEDGDNAIAGAFEREGWLYVATDDTPGTALPPRGDLRGSPLPEAERGPVQQFALHLAAEGFTDWGVTWGMTLRSTHAGHKCSMNASKYSGVRFRAKGKGQVFVKIGIPETVPGEFEGTCKERCWDSHKRLVVLSDQWQDYVLPWDTFQQAGWGAAAKLDPARLLALNFAVGPNEQPTELWVDDLSFITEPPSPQVP
jgi:hypothetical protein